MKNKPSDLLPRKDRIALASLFFCLLAWEGVKHFVPAPKGVNENVWQIYNAIEVQDTVPLDSNLKVDLMEATVDQLRQIGFPARIAYTIEKYKASGGTLRSVKDLMRIYLMDSVILEAVLPHLIFPEPKWNSSKPKHRATEKKLQIDINSATAETWKSLPGIGDVLAARIVKYRDRLGGFYEKEQIKACYGLPPETFDRIKPMLMIGTPVSKIPVNRIRLDTLYHPLLPKKMLRIAEAYKVQHGYFTDATELGHAYPSDTTWYLHALPYLDFTTP